MSVRREYGRAIALVCAFACAFALTIAGGKPGFAAPSAAELGPETALAEPAGGYVGRLQVCPRARPGRHAAHRHRRGISPPGRNSSWSGAP